MLELDIKSKQLLFLYKTCVSPSAPGREPELAEHTQTRAQHVGEDGSGPRPVDNSAI